jgi:hypothetical protein
MMGQVEESTDMQNEKPPEYEVGYRRPPKHTRFQPGTSGNPKGRPRVSKDFAAAFDAGMNERVAVIENGKRKKITICEAILKRAQHQAAAGDHRASKFVIDTWFRIHPEGKQEPSALELMRSLADRAIQYQKAEAQAALDKAD